jgi:tetratricopeptide (TPR) repeat protein
MIKRFCAAMALLFLTTPLLAQDAKPARSGDTITTASGLRYVITEKATGKTRKPKAGEMISAHYDGTFLDGRVFDSSRKRNKPFEFTLGAGQVIKGWDEGFALLQVGERATLIIPPNLAYGMNDRGPIPGGSTLVFDVELLEIKGKGFADLLAKTIESSGIESGVALYRKSKKKGFGDYYLSEDQINNLGYAYLQKGKSREALEIFKINVDAFPKSANVYDSLGEACMTAGDKKEAVKNYRRSLKLDPENENAEVKLKELGAIK